MSDTRRKNVIWSLPTAPGNFHWEHVQVAVLMDIRDQLQQLNRQASCFRIPRALDAMYELGVEARRRKRLAAAKRKKAKAAS